MSCAGARAANNNYFIYQHMFTIRSLCYPDVCVLCKYRDSSSAVEVRLNSAMQLRQCERDHELSFEHSQPIAFARDARVEMRGGDNYRAAKMAALIS